MKVLLKRDQKHKKGIISSSVTFILHIRAELTPEEKEHVDKYDLGNTLLYSSLDETERQDASFLAEMLSIEVRVFNLIHGHEIECKDIFQMIAVEGQLKEACKHFKQILDISAQFGGEEILEF